MINTNAFKLFIRHCEPEALHPMVFRAKGVAISLVKGLLRRFTPRNDNFFVSFNIGWGG
jgi:hypothetical protein